MTRRCELTGKGVMVGNNVSHALNRTRRRFLPNLRTVALRSVALGREVRFRVCMGALRSVEKNGGLAAFLVKARPDVLSLRARRLRREVVRASSS